MYKKAWLLLILGIIVLLSACGAQSQSNATVIPEALKPTATPFQIAFEHHEVPTPTLAPTPSPTAKPSPTPATIPNPQPAQSVPTDILTTGVGSAPYGAPPALTSEEIDLAQKLFAVINSDRSARGLYAYTWNPTLSGGARLHSWNMFHCGFNHTCPDGTAPCQRIANEGYPNHGDPYCAENIAYAGPYPTPWDGAHSIQEGMVNEPPSGWHRIHLLSTSLHSVGVGVYVDSKGYVWFTEDLIN